MLLVAPAPGGCSAAMPGAETTGSRSVLRASPAAPTSAPERTPGLPPKSTSARAIPRQPRSGPSRYSLSRHGSVTRATASRGVEVTFTVTAGGGLVDGQSSVTVPTSRTGHAQVDFQLGLFPGNHVVEASFPGYTGSPAVFTSRGIERNGGAPTTFTAIVQDNAGQPIGGALAYIKVGGQLAGPVSSSPDGVVTFPDLPQGGAAELLIDARSATLLGGQATSPDSFPALNFNMVLVQSANNSHPGPVLFPKLDPRNGVAYDGTHDVMLKCNGIEGLEFIVRAGSMTLASGSKPSVANPETLSLNQVHHDDIPMPMPDGAAPPFAWTFQPAGATFDPPVEIRYPNMTGLPAGSIAYFLTYNHAVEKFDIVSSAHVTDDGAHIISDPGSGLTLSGWGCNCPPYSVTGDCEGDDDDNECEALAQRAANEQPADIRFSLDTNFNGVLHEAADSTTLDRPGQFWINNDQDFVLSDKSGTVDSDLPFITGIHDLEDYFLISINLSEDLKTARKCGYRLRLETSRPGAIAVYKATSQDLTYLQDESQVQGEYTTLAGTTRSFRTRIDPSDLTAAMTEGELSRGELTLLFEGISPGDVDIQVSLAKGGAVLAESEAEYLKLFDIKSMYQSVLASAYDRGRPQKVDDAFPLEPRTAASPLGEVDPGPAIESDIGDTSNTIIFVHGFNMREWEKDSFSETMYKRLWWAGFRGRFVSFRWPCLLAGLFTYNQSEFIAFKYARSLTNFVNQLSGQVHVAAHSQGNILASEAILTGGRPETYIMMQAAVPAMCYYPDNNFFNDPWLRAAEVSKPTFDPNAIDPKDAGYKGYFSRIGNAGTRIVNFYNPLDNALETGRYSVDYFSWRGNQIERKPEPYFTIDASYVFDFDFPDGDKHQVALEVPQQGWPRTSLDRHEIMAFAARSTTKAMGVVGGTGAPIDASFNLSGPGVNFGAGRHEHSGQFNYPIQRLWPFYRRLLRECGISPTN